MTGLYAQKDATVETVFARLAPLEAKLAALEGGLARVLPLADDDPRAAVEGLRARIEALHWAQGEVAAGLAALQAAGAEGGALAGVADQLTRLFAQKDAGAVALLARLQPLEARLAELEARPWDPEADAARAEASAIAAQLIAVQAAAEQTALFADRISELEASLPRLSAAQAQAVADGREAAPPTASDPARSSRRSGPCRASCRCTRSEACRSSAAVAAALERIIEDDATRRELREPPRVDAALDQAALILRTRSMILGRIAPVLRLGVSQRCHGRPLTPFRVAIAV